LRRRLLVCVTALPPLVLIAALFGMLALAAGGVDTVWGVTPGFNLSEVAALRDRGAIIRMIRAGEDPRVARPVRAGFIQAAAVTMTPFEVAIATRRPEVLETILWESGGVDAATWARLQCLAAQDAGLEERLEHYRPDGADAGAPCQEIAPQ
jgi:hypothetical protein